jgi:thiamine-phosphate pyrophosphorylase
MQPPNRASMRRSRIHTAPNTESLLPVLRSIAQNTSAVSVRNSLRGLYAITPDETNFAALLAMVSAALKGGVKIVQYRQKNLAPVDQGSQARKINKLCVDAGAALIINDNVELAQQIDAAGVHLGRDDMHLSEARSILGSHKIIGVSCYDQLALAEEAVASGADYIAFGAFFPSQIKPNAVRAELTLIIEARKKFATPIVAIGGITLQNAPQLIAAGVDAVAVISDLSNAPDIAARAIAFQNLFPEEN